MDHTILLSDDEEAALKDLVERAQDKELTVDIQLGVMVQRALAPFVEALITKQAHVVEQAFMVAPLPDREEVTKILSKKPDDVADVMPVVLATP